MESIERSNCRGGTNQRLIAERLRIQKLRFTTIKATRSNYPVLYEDHNQVLVEHFFVDKPFMHNAIDALWFLRYIAPMWTIADMGSVGNKLWIKLSDCSGRGRKDFTCPFVSAHAAGVIVYAALSVRLIDLNSYIEENLKIHKIGVDESISTV